MERYTAGQLAALAGVTSRTVRYYDTKGLLKPIDHTESGYRLYDKAALERLQIIIMLKFSGFTLEEIQEALLAGQDMTLRDMLEDQRQLLIQRKDQLDEIILLLDNVLEQEEIGELGLLTDSMHRIRRNNHSKRTYDFIMDHGKNDLYPFEFDHLDMKQGMRVLDVGCGYGMIWQHSWSKIPKNTQVTMLDIHKGVLDRFQLFLQEHIDTLSVGTDFYSCVENADNMVLTEQYDRIIMAYLWKYLNDKPSTLKQLYDALNPGGMMLVVNSVGKVLLDMDEIYYECTGERCLEQRYQLAMQQAKELEDALNHQFDWVESVVFDNVLEFTRPLDLYRFMMDSYHEFSDAVKKQGITFVNSLRKYVEQQGTVTLRSRVMLYRCYKEDKP